MEGKKPCNKIFDAELFSTRKTPLDHVKNFVSETLPQYGWGLTQEKEIVLDVGCGPGGNTIQLILPLFQKAEKIFAIDFLPNMIEYAKIHNYHPLIEYNVANIETWSTVEHVKGQISKIISIHCIHWLKDKKRGLKNIFDLLKPGGEAAFCFLMSSPIFTATLKLESDPKWNKFFKDVDNLVPDTHIDKHDSWSYIKMMEEIGYDILYYKDEEKEDPYDSDEEYRDFAASLCVFTSHVPSDAREDFKDDMLQEMLKLNGRDKCGRPVHRANIVQVIARKAE